MTNQKVDVLLGLQWGDEGKGKIVDVLAPSYDLVARFQGGPNAGHTLKFDNKKFVLHQVPSGIFQPQTFNLIGNGVVLDLNILKSEILKVEEGGFQVRNRLAISRKAHLILPTHRLLDAAYEHHKGERKIGSTLKGIGPTYQDKIARNGLRIGDILHPDFMDRYQSLVKRHCELLNFYDFDYELKGLEEEFFQSVDFARSLTFVDGEYYLNKALKEEKRTLAEGAQGTLLDIDFGSYPFVTSSNTFSAGVCTGLGLPPSSVGKVLGIFKAYCTRVGSGPFPTELHDEVGEKLQNLGHEFGATTGRKRRCGWLDLPALKYTVMLNGVTELFMMKADVLNEFSEIKVCTHYELPNGEQTDQLPFDLEREHLKPCYRTFNGWESEIRPETPFPELPAELFSYISFIEEQVGVPITFVSVGPDRSQTIEK